jgi:hypothetical protein
VSARAHRPGTRGVCAGLGGPTRLSLSAIATRCRLRADLAESVVGWGQAVPWPVAFLHLVAEGARSGLRISIAWWRPSRAGGPTAQADRRSRLSDAALRPGPDPEGARRKTPCRAADRDRAVARVADRRADTRRPGGAAFGRSPCEVPSTSAPVSCAAAAPALRPVWRRHSAPSVPDNSPSRSRPVL